MRPFVETWERPGWEVRQWGDDDISELFPLANQNIFDRAEEIAPDHVGQLRSDVLRYELLYRFGGVYVDTDLECLRPLDTLLGGIDCFAAWEAQHRWIGNTILGCSPGHEAMKAVIEGLPRNVRRRAGSRPNKLSGPQYLSRVFRPRKDVTVFDEKLFYPFGWAEAGEYVPGTFDPAERWPNALACHWWRNQRVERGLLP